MKQKLSFPAKYHHRRCVISLPSFDGSYKAENKKFGIKSKRVFNKHKKQIRDLPADKKWAEYKEIINSITKAATEAQAACIERTAHCRLYRNEKKVAVRSWQ